MPIFAFQIGVGFSKTHSKLKYILRILICAIISEIPFLLMLNHSSLHLLPINGFNCFNNVSLNICFTFLIALLTLYFIDIGKKNHIFFIVALFTILISEFIPMDYGIYAVLLVILSYFLQSKKILFTIGIILIAIIYDYFVGSTIQIFMLLALPFILLYNGKKGKGIKYYFYAFYPLHMLILALMSLIIA